MRSPCRARCNTPEDHREWPSPPLPEPPSPLRLALDGRPSLPAPRLQGLAPQCCPWTGNTKNPGRRRLPAQRPIATSGSSPQEFARNLPDAHTAPAIPLISNDPFLLSCHSGKQCVRVCQRTCIDLEWCRPSRHRDKPIGIRILCLDKTVLGRERLRGDPWRRPLEQP